MATFNSPVMVLTDHSTNFISNLIQSTLKTLGSENLSTGGYSPPSNGVCERTGGAIKQILRAIASDDGDWDLYLPLAVASYNASQHSYTEESPYQMVMGREPPPPGVDLPGASSEFEASIRERIESINSVIQEEGEGAEGEDEGNGEEGVEEEKIQGRR